MKAICLVAHPDDCVIFGYKFIIDHPQFDWHIWYLTYPHDSDRVQEMIEFWAQRNVKVSSGGFVDDWSSVEKGELGFDPAHAKTIIAGACENFDLILTHNSLGEYNHPHHIFVHDVSRSIAIPKVYFGNGLEHCNYDRLLENTPFDSNDLPLHKSVIDGFDLTNWRYLITPEAGDVLEYEHE